MRLILLILVFSIYSFAQESDDWPSYYGYRIDKGDSVVNQYIVDKPVKHKVVVSEDFGQEFYISGNLHAEGNLYLEYEYSSTNGDLSTNRKEFVRDGKWTVYFDSPEKKIRSEGFYDKGTKIDNWIIYDSLGKVKYKFEFLLGEIKSKIRTNPNGDEVTFIDRNIGQIFFLKYIEFLFTIVMLVMGLRVYKNLHTYDLIHNTKFRFHGWRKGGLGAYIDAGFRFKWDIKNGDSEELEISKKSSNFISMVSLIILLLYILFIILFSE